MRTDQKIKLRMFLGVRNFKNQNEATANAIPKFAASYAVLHDATDQIQIIGELQGINKTGLAIDKKKAKKQAYLTCNKKFQ
jgi:dipeptidase